MQHECLTYLCRTTQMQSKRPICVVELLTQSPVFILRRWQVEREDRWGHRVLLLGGVTTKPAATGDQPYLMPRLCPSPSHPIPLGAGAGMPSETWGQDSFLSTHAPSEAEHLVPKEDGGSYRGGGGWDDPLSHSSSGSQPLIPGSHFFPLYALPASPPHSLVVLLSGSQLSDWEMAGETEVFCLGRWSREDWGLRTQMHKWSAFPSAPVKLGTCCNT